MPLGDPRSSDLHRTRLVLRPHGKPTPQLVGELDLRGVHMSDRDVRDPTFLIDEVHGVPVRQRGDHEVPQLLQGGLVVERGLEDLSGGREVPDAVAIELGSPLAGRLGRARRRSVNSVPSGDGCQAPLSSHLGRTQCRQVGAAREGRSGPAQD